MCAGFSDDRQKAGKELESIAKAINNGQIFKKGEWRYWPVFVGPGISDFVVIGSDVNYGSNFPVSSKKAAESFLKEHLAIWQRYTQ